MKATSCVICFGVRNTLATTVICLLLLLLSRPAHVLGGILTFGPCLFQYLEPCTNKTIQFYLFTSNRPSDAPVLMDSERPVMPSNMNPAHSMKLLVHGYAGNLDFNATKSIRQGGFLENWLKDLN